MEEATGLSPSTVTDRRAGLSRVSSFRKGYSSVLDPSLHGAE